MGSLSTLEITFILLLIGAPIVLTALLLLRRNESE